MALRFYIDDQKTKLDPDLLDKKAELAAESFFKENINFKGKKYKISISQLRKFYNEVKFLEKKSISTDWEVIYPLIKMIKSKISYATSNSKIKNKKEQEVYKKFREFIIEGIDSIEDEKDFKGFCKYFEATVGFYYAKEGEVNNETVKN